MYLGTMWTYLSGFAAVIYLASPVIFLTLGILPVQALSSEFFVRLLPFLIVNQLLFHVVGRGIKTWRGQQYSLAMFPTWIKSVTSAFGNVYLGRDLDFRVTPKTLQERTSLPWYLIKPQLIAMAVLVLAVLVGIMRMLLAGADTVGTLVNCLWIAFDLLILSVVIEAVRYPGYDAWLAENSMKAGSEGPAGHKKKEVRP
jgi:cellulose synthase (UDP-forming)